MSPRRAGARRLLAAAACTAALWLAAPLRAQDTSGLPPRSESFVTDSAGVIGPERSAQLESYLDQLQKKTGVQFAVLTVRTTGGEDPATYKVRVFKAWGIGRKAEMDGLLLLCAMQERRTVFETGYGLEGTLPDGWQARMLREMLVPRFQAGEYADGITFAVIAASERIAAEKGVTLQWTGDPLRYSSRRSSRGGLLALAFALAALLGVPPWLVIVAGVIGFLLLSRMLGGGSRGGWGGAGPFIGGGWGGGFGGGGGGGGSFGGFGGGSSGGGGGGASW
jgi:uncharacterized protein